MVHAAHSRCLSVFVYDSYHTSVQKKKNMAIPHTSGYGYITVTGPNAAYDLTGSQYGV